MTKTLLEWIHNYSKVARYKVNVEKSNAFRGTSYEQVEFETKSLHPQIEILRSTNMDKIYMRKTIKIMEN